MPALRVITLRLPRELHEALKTAAERNAGSLNRYCVDAVAAALPEYLRRQVSEPVAPPVSPKTPRGGR